MDSIQFTADYEGNDLKVKIKLILMMFEDENGICFIYSPHLDLTGYGKSEYEAKESFKQVYFNFIEYTVKNKTWRKVLKKLGWTVKGGTKQHPKVVAPSINSIIYNNVYVSEIFDKYPVHTFHQDLSLPAFA